MNNSNIINSLFKIKFPPIIQEDFSRKFKYEIFLSQQHNTNKHRCSTYIEVVSLTDPRAIKYGRFIKSDDVNWIFHVPRVINF